MQFPNDTVVPSGPATQLDRAAAACEPARRSGHAIVSGWLLMQCMSSSMMLARSAATESGASMTATHAVSK
jgi:hypothetical protein